MVAVLTPPHAELPSHLHAYRDALDRLYRLLQICQRVLASVHAGRNEVRCVWLHRCHESLCIALYPYQCSCLQ